MQWNPFVETAVVLGLAAMVGALGLRLRQPPIISFLLAGIIVGPSIMGLVRGPHEIDLLARIGISLLLFVVGLRLDVGMIRTVGPVALATGLGQVVFTSLGGVGIALALGMPMLTAVYVAVALTFSSTIIIVKLLSDKREIDSLHGRIAVGFLIVQDLVAILALIGLSAMADGAGRGRSLMDDALAVVGKGLLFLGAVLALMRWVLPRATAYLARSRELLVLSAIAWAVLLAAGGEWLGFSKEVGAFAAGVSLASTPQRDAIGARLVVLRDFLLLFFFIDLGARLDLSALRGQFAPAALLSAFVLIGNPLIVMTIMGVMSYRRRTGFMCGLSVAQISEFSLILAAMGVSLGHIDASVMALVTLVGLVTILVSTYMILYSGPLYARLSPLLGIFERANARREQAGETPASGQDQLVILMGLGRYGSEIAVNLQRHGWNVLAMDFDPQALQRGRRLGVPVRYGDMGDLEMIAQLPLDRARWVVCTLRDVHLNLSLLHLLHNAEYAGRIALTAGDPAHARRYRSQGAHLVFEPFADSAEQAAEALAAPVHVLPGLTDWPATLEEVVLRPGTILAGKSLRELAIRRELGVSVLAVSRAGTVHFDPSPDFRLFPGDRLALLGDPETMPQAGEFFRQREVSPSAREDSAFKIAQVPVGPDSPWVGSTLEALDFRNRYGVTVIGVRRQEQKLTSWRTIGTIQPRDRLIVMGSPSAVDQTQSTVRG